VFSEFFGTKNPFAGIFHLDADFFVGQVDSSANTAFGKKFGGLHGLSNSAALEPSQEKPVEFDLKLSLEEAYSGCIKKMKITKNVG
jgi:DnaJ family protein B protein 13